MVGEFYEVPELVLLLMNSKRLAFFLYTNILSS